ncbi:ornithine decarboxylase-like [Dreissena polymorpha]|uniref:ornithine decarboxylase-like n=1 Tax=Dreissena polymorpha TaxID=45954 RepID=UPI002264C3AA|nr:ornithine decarboxylase-like [Dreissena polymorpha]
MNKVEIQKILSIGVSPSRIIYAHPCKQSSLIRFSANSNVEMMTFDNESELHKVKSLFPTAKLVLRILPPSKCKCLWDLSIKSGVKPAKAIHLLRGAKSIELDVKGVSFHVGGGCLEPEAMAATFKEARMVFDQGRDLGFNMMMLDIGGGFPGHASVPVSFHSIAQVVNMALEKYFPAEEGIEFIAEPGTYMVASGFTLAVNIISKRIEQRDGELTDQPNMSDNPVVMYYISDGVYGSFSTLRYDHTAEDQSSHSM